MSFEPKFETSGQLLDEYISRSWRSNAQRQRAKGADFESVNARAFTCGTLKAPTK